MYLLVHRGQCCTSCARTLNVPAGTQRSMLYFLWMQVKCTCWYTEVNVALPVHVCYMYLLVHRGQCFPCCAHRLNVPAGTRRLKWHMPLLAILIICCVLTCSSLLSCSIRGNKWIWNNNALKCMNSSLISSTLISQKATGEQLHWCCPLNDHSYALNKTATVYHFNMA